MSLTEPTMFGGEDVKPRDSSEQDPALIEYAQSVVLQGIPIEIENAFSAISRLESVKNDYYFTDRVEEAFAQIDNTIELFREMYRTDVRAVVDDINRVILEHPGRLHSSEGLALTAAKLLWDSQQHAELVIMTEQSNQSSGDE